MSKSLKIYLLDFVKDIATKHQLINLLLNGKIINSINNNDKILLENKFNSNKKLQRILNETLVSSSIGMLLINPEILVSWRNIKRQLIACLKICESSKNKNVCLTQCRIDDTSRKIKFLKDNIKYCSKKSKPDSCRDKILKSIKILEDKNTELKSRKNKLL
jgi:hypothetical protein